MESRVAALTLTVVLVELAAAPVARPADQTFKLAPDVPASYDDFGRSVALDGSRCIVGSVGDDDNGSVSGSAYIFDTTTGQQLLKLLPNDGQPVDNFGISVDLDGSRCIVGAYADDDNGKYSGSVYLYDACPAILTLVAAPDVALPNDPLSFATYGGTPGQPCALVITHVNAAPTWILFLTGTFDAQCRNVLAIPTPAGLAGSSVTMQAAGYTPSGLQLSNPEVVQFQ